MHRIPQSRLPRCAAKSLTPLPRRALANSPTTPGFSTDVMARKRLAVVTA